MPSESPPIRIDAMKWSQAAAIGSTFRIAGLVDCPTFTNMLRGESGWATTVLSWIVSSRPRS